MVLKKMNNLTLEKQLNDQPKSLQIKELNNSSQIIFNG